MPQARTTLSPEARWPLILELTKLGWSRTEIAEAIDCSEATVKNDQSAHGGVALIAPNRETDKDQISIKSHKLYAELMESRESPELASILERELKINELKVIWESVSMAYVLLRQPDLSSLTEPYRSLLLSVTGVSIPEKLESVPWWEEFLVAIIDEKIAIPYSGRTEAVVRYLERRQQVREETRRRIGEEAQSVIDEALLSYVTERQRYVLVRRFGLFCPVRNYNEIGREMGFAKETIRQIEKKGFERIKDFLGSSGFLELLKPYSKSTVGLLEHRMLQKKLQGVETELADFKRLSPAEKAEARPEIEKKLVKPIDEVLELSVRSTNLLKRESITFIYELIEKSEGDLLIAERFGRKSVNEMMDELKQHDLKLKMELRPQEVAVIERHRLKQKAGH